MTIPVKLKKTNKELKVVEIGICRELFYLVHVFFNGLNGFLTAERAPKMPPRVEIKM